ncbi:MAG: DUF2318 domain-containing protein [Rhodospirillales bacterium]|nr:DUF2318 domain-containing protein [Rhodospirillales bacterium]
MIAYLVDMIHAFGPIAVVCGLVLALRPQTPSRAFARAAIGLLIAGLVLGAGAYQIAHAQGFASATRTGMHLAGMTVMALALIALAARSLRSGLAFTLVGPLLVFVMAARSAFVFARDIADRSLSAASVLNTELILNLTALFTGTLAVAGLTVLVLQAGRHAQRVGAWVLAALLVAESGVSTATALLGLLQLQAIEVTAARVSFVARAGEAAPWAIYGELILVGLLAVAAFAGGGRSAVPPPRAVERRQVRARMLSRRRWLTGAMATASFLIVALLYHDLYASLPPSLSPAQPVQPDAQGLVRIDVNAVKDGKLYRYAYITSDGHRVRFFLINRYDVAHAKIGVVYDACMICGDDGYIQVGNEIICIACNVRIFVPSIGKPGGCNPIPLDHTVEGGVITIAAADLDKGAKYFSEVVEIEVTDPVTGKRLINLKAPFQYEFKGRMFYFEGRESYDRFKKAPEEFAGNVEGRYFRVQGHRDS